MTYGSDARDESNAYERPSRASLLQNLISGAALAFVALACAWSVYANLCGDHADPVVAVAPVVTVHPTAPAAPEAPIDPDLYALLFDSTYSGGFPAGTLSESEPREFAGLSAAPASRQAAIPIAPDVSPPPPADRRLVQSVPLPAPRPFERLAESRNPSLYKRSQRSKVPPGAPPDNRNFLERLFGTPQATGPTLAYAAPDGGVSGDGQSLTPGRLGSYDRWTAVYDISARTVYMPDGTKLEAHSGLGNRLDDPRHVHERMRGATPPHVYDLEMRAGLFHGVRAIRLIPVGGEGNVFGRTGLLAHTYMLGPNGDSNGCVSIRNYHAFLRAFENREIKRLVVVARLG